MHELDALRERRKQTARGKHALHEMQPRLRYHAFRVGGVDRAPTRQLT